MMMYSTNDVLMIEDGEVSHAPIVLRGTAVLHVLCLTHTCLGRLDVASFACLIGVTDPSTEAQTI